MSTHSVNVVKVGAVAAHGNADSLDIIPVWGYTAITRKGQFSVGDLAVYIEPDYIVPLDRPEFSHLTDARIRCKRLRGVWSQGLLIPAPEGSYEGQDLMAYYGIVRYDPEIRYNRTGGVKGTPVDAESPHPTLKSLTKYDLENLRRYTQVFTKGEPVHVSEKIHGSFARFAWRDGRMWYGSRTQWKKPECPSWWTRAVECNPWIEDWCKHNQESVIYGEIYGNQDLKYGVGQNEMAFRAFDIHYKDRFLNVHEFLGDMDPNRVVPYEFLDFDLDTLVEKSRQNSRLAHNQISEGIVVKPVVESVTHITGGRKILKLVSDKYLERAK